MKDDSNKKSGFPGGGQEEDLLAEFDAWDKNFGDLFRDSSQDLGARTKGVSAPGNPATNQVPGPAPGPIGDPAGGDDLLDETGDFGDELAGETGEFEFDFDAGDAAFEGAGPAAAAAEADELDLFDGEPRALGDLLGAAVPPLDLDDIEDGDVEPSLSLPFEQDADDASLSAAMVDGAAALDIEDSDDGLEVFTSAARPREASPAAIARGVPGGQPRQPTQQPDVRAPVIPSGAAAKTGPAGKTGPVEKTGPAERPGAGPGPATVPRPAGKTGANVVPRPVAGAAEKTVPAQAARPAPTASAAATARPASTASPASPASPGAAAAGRPERPSSKLFEPLADTEDDDSFDPFADPAEDASAQVTKVIEIDEELLAATALDQEDKPRPKRTATIVRRDELERLRAERKAREDEDEDDGFGGKETSIIDEKELETLAGSSAAEPARPSKPAVSEVHVEDDFYDDIVIDQSGAASAAARSAEPAPAARRVSRNVVRRAEGSDDRKASGPKPVLRVSRPRDAREADLERQLAAVRDADPDSTLDLRTAMDGSLVPNTPGAGMSREDEIQAIIDKAAVALRNQKAAQSSSQAGDLTPPGGVRVPERPSAAQAQAAQTPVKTPVKTTVRGVAHPVPAAPASPPAAPAAPAAPATSDELEWEPEWEPEWEFGQDLGQELAQATAEEVEAAPSGPLDDVDVLPELPPGKLPTAEPALDLGALSLPEQVEPATREDLAARSEELAAQLLLYERELALADESAQTARLCLEAGRLAERLGDVERARNHYEDALRADPRLTPAMRALRRIERAVSNWPQALAYLDAEVAEASQLEQRALRAHRADLFWAHGARDEARAAVVELLTEAPGDSRALLLGLELAFVDGDGEELTALLQRLTEVLDDDRLRGSLYRLHGRLLDRSARAAAAAGGDPTEIAVAAAQAFAGAATVGSHAALLDATRAARSLGDMAGAVASMGQLLELATSDSINNLATRDPGYAAALHWRRSVWADEAEDVEARWAALVAAAALAPEEPLVLAVLGTAAEAHGDTTSAAEVFLRLGDVAPSAVERADAHVRAAHHLAAQGRDADAAQLLRSALELDPTHATAAVALERALERAGDVAALIALDQWAAAADPAMAVFERVRAARRLAEAGRHDEALAELAAGREAVDAPALHDALERTLALAGRAEERVEFLSSLVDSPGLALDAETALVRAAQAGEAYARQLIAVAAAAGEALDEATAAARDQAVVAAFEAWNRVLAVNPESVIAHGAALRLADLLGHPDLLEDALARAQVATPHAARAVALGMRRVDLLLAHHPDGSAADEIERILREVAALAPRDPRPSLGLLLHTAAAQRFADAAMALEDRAVALGPGHESVSLRYRAAALLLDPTDDPDQAATLLEHVVTARPDFEAAAELLRAARRRLGVDTPEPLVEPGSGESGGLGAMAFLDPRGTDGDSFARVVREAEACHYRLGDLDRAMSLYRQALILRPNDVLARHGLIAAAEAAAAAQTLAELAQQALREAERAGNPIARADACEELARIDGELRGDAASALRHLQAALAVDPGRHAVVRALERAHMASQRWAELLALYERQEPGSAQQAVALAVERAHLAERLAASASAGAAPAAPASDRALAHYRRAYELDPRCRLALFHLEAHARAQGASAELAALEAAVATYMAGDERAQAAFLTRAGEVLADLGDIDAAIARFQEANEVAQTGEAQARGYAPALFAWRQAALQGQLWIDVAESAVREARLVQGASAEATPDQVALYHLAGVALMDRAVNAERALTALGEVLRLDPAHDDAFVRTRILLQELGDHERLAELLTRRIEVETHPGAKARLHRELAELYRSQLDDLASARKHLAAMLELAPGSSDAIADLSEIAWKQGAWEQAAQGLIARAQAETDPAALAQVFTRLGIIYAEHLPDPGRAIKAFKRVLTHDSASTTALDHLSRLGMDTGDWQLALAACERLIRLDRDDDAKVEHLHRLGKIYQSGLKDQARAERAYRMALDLVPTSHAALTALAAFYEARGDLRSMRVHLDRMAGAMRSKLAKDGSDGTAYRVIARAMHLRQRAGVDGSLAAARCAAELALLLGAGEDVERDIVAEAAARPQRATGLQRQDAPELDERLYPALVSHAVRQLFAVLGERIAKHVGVDLRRYEVGRGDRLRGREDAVAVVFEEVAAELGMEAPAVYVSQKHPTVLAAEPTSPVSVVIGAELAKAASRDQLRFAAGRVLKLCLASLAVPARMTRDELGALLVALLRLFDAEILTFGMNAQAVEAHYQRLRRLVPGSVVQELGPVALGIAGVGFDPGAVWSSIIELGNRAGLLACGSVEAGLGVLRITGGHADVPAAMADAEGAALVRFSISEDHAVLRGLLDNG